MEALIIPGNSLPIQAVVGGTLMLKGHYSIHQYWLPFMNGVVLMCLDLADIDQENMFSRPQARHIGQREMQRLLSRKVAVSAGARDMYDYHSADIDQAVLPFAEHKQVRAGDLNRATAHWDRDDSGQIHNLLIVSLINDKELLEELHQWCRTLAGRYYVQGNNVFFEFYRDWLFAKLRWYQPS